MDTEKALKIHNMYARTEMLGSICFPGEEKKQILSAEELKGTLHLWPFLELLVTRLGKRLGRKIDPLSEELARTNWIGREEIFKEIIPAQELIKKIFEINPEDPLRQAYNGYSSRLADLKLVTNHMGVVILDAAIGWLDLLDGKEREREIRIKSILNHINTCSVKAVEVKLRKGIPYYKTWEVSYYVNLGFHLETSFSPVIPLIDKSLVEGWGGKGGIYSIHKHMIVELLENQEDFSTIHDFTNLQLYLFNRFIKSQK